MTEPTGPLKGLKIVDMSTVVLGPFATLNFADLGAEVIKVENGEGKFAGDMMRHAGDSPTGDLGPIYTALNRNKKSITINAKDADEKAALKNCSSMPMCSFTMYALPEWNGWDSTMKA